jgi:hypothetical protein
LVRRVSFDNRWLAVSPLELIEAGQQHNPIDKISHIVIIVCFNYKTLADELDAKGVTCHFTPIRSVQAEGVKLVATRPALHTSSRQGRRKDRGNQIPPGKPQLIRREPRLSTSAVPLRAACLPGDS